MKLFLWSLTLLAAIIFLSACHRDENESHEKIVAIKQQAIKGNLFYTGTIRPLQTLVIPSPAEGAIIETFFQYGEEVKKGQLLFTVSSAKFLADYKAALMQYIKTKNDFNNATAQFSEGKFLHNNLLISDDDFKMKQSNYYAAQLALLQAKDSLESLLHQLDIKDVNPYKLTIADIDKITEALHLQISSENLRILSPRDGVLLSPSKSDEDNKKVIKGDVVKQGDVLAVIGDMNGLSVRIKVNELTVNQLKVGQKVKVTGVAFPDFILNGEIHRIDHQGEGASGGLPTFAIDVIVPHLSDRERKEIHVGMSAKVEIEILEDPQIIVPLTAIKEKGNTSWIKVYNAKTKEKREILVQTGKTTLDSVAILSGLKIGDQIVIPN